VGCDGQVLVTHDLLGLFDRFTPKFVKQYLNINQDMVRAFTRYKSDVDTGKFPEKSHSISLLNETWEAFLAEANDQFDEQS
jgi:3-methyl-2-oxobutanoate hydroxymethyltransferase